MKEKILQTLRELRAHAVQQGAEVKISYHAEDSHLMRFANSAISLNTNEQLSRLEFTAFDGRKRASYEMISGLDDLPKLKQGIDHAIEMAHHAQALTYDPTIPLYKEDFSDESGFDAGLADLDNETRLSYFNQVAGGLETEEIKLSGIFSNGTNTLALINTRSEHTQYYCFTDCQITVVLAHSRLKWEVVAEQSAQKKAELNPAALHKRLALMLDLYQKGKPEQLPLGKYDVVFGSAATGAWLDFAQYIGLDGGEMKRGGTFLAEKDYGVKKFSDRFTLLDDATRMETFPFRRDYSGIDRGVFPIIEDGVFKSFVWGQDDADEFGVEPTGQSVMHLSLAVKGGQKPVNSLEELLAMPRDRDILFIPYIHYIGIVNPTEGILTGSSRFGALLLKKDGSVAIPYNVRFTQSLLTFFGDGIEWLSSETVPYNTSRSYGARNPTAIIVPRFMRVNDLEISHSNQSY
ncbi:MAG: metallopeptidase TldD-related protein [Anaerolineaceae bacterium]